MAAPVLFVAGRSPLEELSGGHSAYVRSHALAARAAGFEPRLFCVTRRPGLRESDFGVVEGAAAGAWPPRQMFVMRHGPRLAAAVERFALGARGPHVIHGFGVWGAAAVDAARRLARRGQRARALVSSYTTYEAENRSKVTGVSREQGLRFGVRFAAELAWLRVAVNPYERIAYEQADAVLYNYDSVLKLLAARYRLPDASRKLPYSVEGAFRPRLPLASLDLPPALSRLVPRDAPLLVTVARADPRKGLDVLLRALARLRSEGVALRACLIGAGPLLRRYRRLTGQLGLSDRTALVGAVRDSEPYLRRADVFALPSLGEQSGSLAVLEALRAGVAVVASGCDGLLEDLVHEHDALLVEPGSVAALAAAIRRLLGDRALRERIAQRGSESFAQRFGPERFSRALREVYAEALAGA